MSNLRKRDIMGIIEFDFYLLQDKIENSLLLHLNTKSKNVGFIFGGSSYGVFIFRERSTSFSLGYLAIGPLDFDGVRRENVLRGAGYAWTPGLRVFDNSKR